MLELSNSQTSELSKLYQEDFYLWLDITAQLLKQRKFTQLDLDHLIEEIETMGRSEKRELTNRLRILLEHLLKLTYWQEERAYNQRGWLDTIIEQRRQIKSLLEASPSLKPLLAEIFPRCYSEARKDTLAKTGLSLDRFPLKSPFTMEDILED